MLTRSKAVSLDATTQNCFEEHKAIMTQLVQLVVRREEDVRRFFDEERALYEQRVTDLQEQVQREEENGKSLQRQVQDLQRDKHRLIRLLILAK